MWHDPVGSSNAVDEAKASYHLLRGMASTDTSSGRELVAVLNGCRIHLRRRTTRIHKWTRIERLAVARVIHFAGRLS
jgi:hypothetical protein